MEKIVDLVKLAELKQHRIREFFDQSFGGPSSILALTIQQKDLEDQFQFAKDCLLNQARELDLQSEKIAEKTLALEQREREVWVKSREVPERLDNLQSDDACLSLIKEWIRERSLEVSVVENRLYLGKKKKVEDCNESYNMRRDQLELVRMQHEEVNRELDEKRKQLGGIEKSVEEYSGKLKLDETMLDLVTDKLGECCKVLCVKNAELESVEKLLQVCTSELEAKSKEVERVRVLAANCDEELEKKQKELSRVENLISDCDSELELKRKQLRRLDKWTNKYTSKLKSPFDHCQDELDFTTESHPNLKNIQEDKELDLKEKELAKVQKLIEHAVNDFNSKKAQLESIEVLTAEYAEELEAKEKRYEAINFSINKCSEELEMKLTELKSVENSNRELSSKLKLEKRILASVEKHSEKVTDAIKSKEKDFKSLKEKMKTNCRGLELKLNAVQESIRKRKEELTSKENMLSSVQMSVKESTEELESMKNQQKALKTSIMELSEELESKKKSLDLVERPLKECCDELASKQAEVEIMQRTTCGLRLELEEREKYLDSVKITVDQRLEKLQMKEGEFEACVKELELREQKIDLIQKSVDERSEQLEHKERQLNEKYNHTSNSLAVDYQCCIADGKSLQLILNENLKKYDSFLNEVIAAIQKSTNPGKLVLDAIEGFYPKNRDTEYSLDVVRKSCTILIGQLLKISPPTKPEVREEAMKVASDWKSRMKTQPKDSLEVLAYLRLLAAFKLSNSVSCGELQSLLDVIYQNSQALELQQAFRFVKSLPDEKNPVQAHTTDNSSIANVHSGTPIYNLACPLILELDDDMDSYELIPSKVLAALKQSSDPAKLVLDVLQGSYSQHCKNGGSGLDIGVAKGITVLLGQLIEVSREVTSLVKVEAVKLAVLWKSKFTLETVNDMEIRAFLLFLCAYGLVSYFKGDEILRLVAKIASHKSVHMMCRLLGFTDKIPELIQILIKNKQHIDAARFSCAYGLVHDFPLDTILLKSVEHVHKDAQEKARERELAARKAVFQCITDYKLESRYDTEDIVRRIADLENEGKSSERSFRGCSKRRKLDISVDRTCLTQLHPE